MGILHIMRLLVDQKGWCNINCGPGTYHWVHTNTQTDIPFPFCAMYAIPTCLMTWHCTICHQGWNCCLCANLTSVRLNKLAYGMPSQLWSFPHPLGSVEGRKYRVVLDTAVRPCPLVAESMRVPPSSWQVQEHFKRVMWITAEPSLAGRMDSITLCLLQVAVHRARA